MLLPLGLSGVLLLNTNGTVKSYQKIGDTAGGFAGTLDDGDWFGTDTASLGDLDGDGVTDLAVGALGDDDGGVDHGAVWVLFLNPNGTVKSYQKISDTAGGFAGILDDGDWFGYAAASLGDLDGDGVGDLAVGAHNDDDGGSSRGAVWVLLLNTNGRRTARPPADTAAATASWKVRKPTADVTGIGNAPVPDARRGPTGG